ncbi:MAG: hypothetical protein JSS02_27135 [Planctomycetes bacterium]|nr:hypothetical protein [Planctomycetota bacterium]
MRSSSTSNPPASEPDNKQVRVALVHTELGLIAFSQAKLTDRQARRILRQSEARLLTINVPDTAQSK